MCACSKHGIPRDGNCNEGLRLVVKIVESHASGDVQVLVRAREMIDKQRIYSVEDAVSVIEEMAEY